MAQYIDKSALVAEIKRRIKEHHSGYLVCLKDMLSFIDTLEVKKEPVSEDLEEAARRIATRHSHITGDTYYANDAWFFKKGAQWQKKQMMKDAVYGLVCGHDDNSPAWIDLNLLNKPDVKVGEEIKLIIIKEE